MKKMWEKLAYVILPLIIGIGLGILLVLFFLNKDDFKEKFLSPLGFDPIHKAARVPSKKPLIGFLPYWNLKEAEIAYHLIDWLVYFSLTLDGNGEIVKREGRNLDMGWYWLKGNTLNEILETAKKNEVKTAIAFTVFDNENIDAILQNSQASEKAIENMLNIVEEYEFEGINLDFEYNLSQEIVYGAGENYANFIQKLREEMKKKEIEAEISVDLYGNGLINNYPYKVQAFIDEIDWLILMGYDYHSASSNQPGPVAPLYSDKKKSISQSLEAGFEKQIDEKKVILAMPFYGYEWLTASKQLDTETIPGSGAMASYKRVNKLIKEQDLEVKWDQQAMSPYLIFEEEGVWHQIYFENDESIGLKLELIEQLGLGGGAIWALGYEEVARRNRIVEFVGICNEVYEEYQVPIILCVQATDIYQASKGTRLSIFAQHIDPVEPGKYTGFITWLAVKEDGAKGTLINHSEHRVGMEAIKQTIEICQRENLKSLVCVESPAEAAKVDKYKPDMIALEEPLLIGGEVSIVKNEEGKKKVEEFLKLNLKAKCLVGAGVKDGQDMRVSKQLGAKGVLLASGIVKAKNPKKVLIDLCQGFK